MSKKATKFLKFSILVLAFLLSCIGMLYLVFSVFDHFDVWKKLRDFESKIRVEQTWADSKCVCGGDDE